MDPASTVPQLGASGDCRRDGCVVVAYPGERIKVLWSFVLTARIFERRAVQKSLQRGIERLDDIKDEGVHYVKRHPLKAITMAAAVGLMVGVAAAWITRRFRR